MLLDLMLVTLAPPFIVLIIAGYMLISGALTRRLRDRQKSTGVGIRGTTAL